LPEIVLSVCFGILALCTLLIAAEAWGRLIWQSLFLVYAMVIVYVFTRYLASSYTYTLSEQMGVFLVVQKKGRRLTTLCRMDLAALYRVRLYDPADKAGEGRADRYSYCMNPSPEISYLLFFRDGCRTATVRVEVDTAFLHLLQQVTLANARREEEAEEDLSDL
jgi:hypothetical protein